MRCECMELFQSYKLNTAEKLADEQHVNLYQEYGEDFEGVIVVRDIDSERKEVFRGMLLSEHCDLHQLSSLLPDKGGTVVHSTVENGLS